MNYVKRALDAKGCESMKAMTRGSPVSGLIR